MVIKKLMKRALNQLDKNSPKEVTLIAKER